MLQDRVGVSKFAWTREREWCTRCVSLRTGGWPSKVSVRAIPTCFKQLTVRYCTTTNNSNNNNDNQQHPHSTDATVPTLLFLCNRNQDTACDVASWCFVVSRTAFAFAGHETVGRAGGWDVPAVAMT